jgi:hypothetical protein
MEVLEGDCVVRRGGEAVGTDPAIAKIFYLVVFQVYYRYEEESVHGY